MKPKKTAVKKAVEKKKGTVADKTDMPGQAG